MAELITQYLGLTLPNPLIAGSSGLTAEIGQLKNLAKNGIGAVVLKSLFEEQILMEAEHDRQEARKHFMLYADHAESFDYLDMHLRREALEDYLQLIRQAKKELMIPVICGIFLIENLSVVMQVSYFKYTKKKFGEGRRIFKMSPLHHHYQKLGYHESKIVTRFWIVGIMLAVLSLVTLKLR